MNVKIRLPAGMTTRDAKWSGNVEKLHGERGPETEWKRIKNPFDKRNKPQSYNLSQAVSVSGDANLEVPAPVDIMQNRDNSS